MSKSKKFRGDPKKFDVDSEKNLVTSKEIEKKAHYIANCCLFYDLTPGGAHDAVENFVMLLELLILCGETKLYSVRDEALRRIVDSLTE